MTPFLSETIGTFILILLGNGVVANVLLKNTKGHGIDGVNIFLGWGIAVFCGVIVGMESGAHLNPAVSIGLAFAGKFAWSDLPVYVSGQMLGACLGSLGVWLTYKNHYEATDELDLKLATFSTAPAIRNYFWNVTTEAIGTFVLVFVVLFVVGPEVNLAQDPDATIGLGSIGALPVALLVMGIGFSLGGPTGYAINPARDLGPRIMHTILPIGKKRDSDWSYAWVPILGPILGGSLAAFLYLLIV